MNKFNKKTSIGCLSVILVLLSFYNSFGQIQDTDILNRRIDLNLKEETLFQVCDALAYFEGIPIGLEKSSDLDKEGESKSIEIKSGTLKEVLDSIVKQIPDYQWEIRDGVVNIYPVRLRDDILTALLETKIENVSLKKDSERQYIAGVIYKADEINTLLNSKKTALGIATKVSTLRKDVTADINISNTELKSILNKVVKESTDSKFWAISRNKDEKIFLSF